MAATEIDVIQSWNKKLGQLGLGSVSPLFGISLGFSSYMYILESFLYCFHYITQMALYFSYLTPFFLSCPYFISPPHIILPFLPPNHLEMFILFLFPNKSYLCPNHKSRTVYLTNVALGNIAGLSLT